MNSAYSSVIVARVPPMFAVLLGSALTARQDRRVIEWSDLERLKLVFDKYLQLRRWPRMIQGCFAKVTRSSATVPG